MHRVSTNLPEGAVVAPLSALMAHPDFSQQIGSVISARLAQTQGGGEVFTALNTAGFADVMVVWLRADQVLDQPVHIVRAAQAGAIAHLRTLVIAERHASFTLVESFWGDDEQTRCNNSVTEIWLEAGAQVNHIRLQDEGAQTFHIAKTAVSQAADSRYQCTAIDSGGKAISPSFRGLSDRATDGYSPVWTERAERSPARRHPQPDCAYLSPQRSHANSEKHCR